MSFVSFILNWLLDRLLYPLLRPHCRLLITVISDSAWHANLISGISEAKVLEYQGPRRLDVKAQVTKALGELHGLLLVQYLKGR